MNGPLVANEPLVLYDGDCGFCHGCVRFLLHHERANALAPLKFAALKSPPARAALIAHGMAGDYVESVVLIEDGRAYVESTSVLRLARHLRWPWRAGVTFLLVPRPLRDAVYRFVARHRGKLAPRVEHCEVPMPSRRERFIDACRGGE